MRTTRISAFIMETALEYEYILRNAFECNRLEYGFVDAGLYRNPDAYDKNCNAVYLQCALIVLANRKDGNEEILRECIKMLDENTTTECVDTVMDKLSKNNVVY